MALSCALDEEQTIETLTEMTRALPDTISAAHAQDQTYGLSEQGLLAQTLITHANERLASITANSSGGHACSRARPG